MDSEHSNNTPRLWEHQTRCTGIFYFNAAMRAQSKPPVCVGLSAPADVDDMVDNCKHHLLRGLEEGAPIKSFACLGTTTHYTQDAFGNNIAPPCCEGLELLKFDLQHSSDLESARAAGSTKPEGSSSFSSPAAVSQTACAVQQQGAAAVHVQANCGSFKSSGSCSPTVKNYTSTINSSASQCNRDSSTLQEEEQQQQQQQRGEEVPRALTFQEACEKYSQLASEADPLWFAKAFAGRAAINLQHMGEFAIRLLFGDGSK